MALVFVRCSSAPVDEFSEIKANMTKDEVIEAIGSPKRVERVDGKEKWAYRYWTGDDNNLEVLKHVTFYNGKVIEFGDDTEEAQRLDEMKKTDDGKKERRKLRSDEVKKRAAQEAKAEQEVHATKNVIPAGQPGSIEDELEKAARKRPVEFKEIRGTSQEIESAE